MTVKLPIRFAESAVEDFEQIITYYTEQEVPDIGYRFVSEIIQKIENLAGFPEMGRIVPEFNSKSLRELIHPPYRIVYRLDPKHIRIVRIWRSERLLRLPNDD
jgi:plasmid stabilization system protein ParE